MLVLPLVIVERMLLSVFSKLLGGLIELIEQLVLFQTGAVAGGGNDGFAFVAVHEERGFEEMLFLAFGNGQKAVFVCVN